MKGIILAAGKGTRLYPASMHISKILLPIYDKPMIYYPLATLMSAGIRDILIIVTKEDKAYFKKLLGDGKQFGISIKYAIQKVQRGIADALIVGERFINGDSVALVLGDNVFYGEELNENFAKAMAGSEGATVFCKRVENPKAFGVAEVDKDGNVIDIEEKPLVPKSDLAVTGLYIYDKNASTYAKMLKPSVRGELEITDLNKIYLKLGMLNAELLDDAILWADTGTFDSLLQMSNKVYELEKTGRTIIACPEEIALSRGFVTKKQLGEWIVKYKPNAYYDYVNSLLQ